MAASTKKVIYAALIGNVLIALTKFVAGAVTGSSAMFSEGIHSVVDVGNQVLLLFGLKQARRPASDVHPFGHGKEIYFWGFVVAILIFAVGAGFAIYEGIHHLQHPGHLTNVVVNYIVLGVAILFELGSFTVAIREFSKVKGKVSTWQAVRRGKDPTLFIVLFEDTAALAGLVVALLGVFLGHVTGSPVFDGGASIAIGLVLAGTAMWLAYETKGLLIGEAADPAVVSAIREMACAQPGVMCVNEVLTLHMGPEFVLVNLTLDFADDLGAATIENAIAALDARIREAFPVVKRVFVAADTRSVPAPPPLA